MHSRKRMDTWGFVRRRPQVTERWVKAGEVEDMRAGGWALVRVSLRDKSGEPRALMLWRGR
jgi:hypothetical protein